VIDFKLKPYEWQKKMDIIMQNVNLNQVKTMGTFAMAFEFRNSYDGNHYKKIVCNSVWKLSSDMCFSTGDEFPFFICDIRVAKLENAEIEAAFKMLNYGLSIPHSKEYYLLCMDSGDISISLICEKIEVLDM